MPSMRDHILSSPQRLAREICADIMATEDEIAEAIEQAVSFERKRCAAIADEFASNAVGGATFIANRIAARIRNPNNA